MISGIISAGADLVGSAASAAASKYAADKSYQAQIETNEMNYKINQENNSANAAMVDKQNEYNSAVNQRLRLEAAGMNPYMMMNGGSAGTSNVSVDGTQKPVQLDAPKLDYSNFANTLATAPSAAIDTFVKGASALNQVKQSAATLDKTVKETKNTEARTELALAQKDNQLIQNDIAKATKDVAISQAWENLDQTRRITDGIMYDNAYKSLQNQYYPEAIKASIAKDIADTSLAKAQTKNIEELTPATLNKIMNEAATEVAKKRNLDMNTWRVSFLTPLEATSLRASINKLYADTEYIQEQTRYIPKYYNLENAKNQQGWFGLKLRKQELGISQGRLKLDQYLAPSQRYMNYGAGTRAFIEPFTNAVGDFYTRGAYSKVKGATQGSSDGYPSSTTRPFYEYNRYNY